MTSEKLNKPIEVKTVWLKQFIDSGKPTIDLFEIRGTQLEPAQLKDGGIIVQILCFSVDPYLSSYVKSHGRPKAAGNLAFSGFVSGKVIASKNSKWKVGDLFGSNLTFSTYLLLQKSDLEKIMMWKLTDYISEKEISKGVGILGMTGCTAYAGVVDILKPNPGETLFVSAASGAVGHLLSQIAKIYGVKTVIGSCGGEDKCKKLKDSFGYDYAINYQLLRNDKNSLVNELKKAAPDGIDMYFEQVGGIHFDAAFEVLKPSGRVGVCGVISTYHEKDKVASQVPLSDIVSKQLRIEGFMCSDWLAGKKSGQYFTEAIGQWMKEGKIEDAETLVHGIKSWSEAFCSLFESGTKHVGKLSVMV